MPLLKITSLVVNGITLPPPKADGGFKIKREKVWSSNTGRTADATAVGTIVAIKYSIDITWPPLPVEKVQLIESAASDKDTAFAPMTFTDMTGTTRTINVYFGTPSYSCFEWINGQWCVTDVSASVIEQ